MDGILFFLLSTAASTSGVCPVSGIDLVYRIIKSNLPLGIMLLYPEEYEY
jgi:hypothetical protein